MDALYEITHIPIESDHLKIRTTNSKIPHVGIPGGIIKYVITSYRFAKESTDDFTKTTTVGVIPKEKYFLVFGMLLFLNSVI